MMGNVPEYKIVVLGAGGVGKSALTIRLVTGIFVEDYDPTIEDSYRKSAVIDDKPCLMDILDTAGQEEFASMQDGYIRVAEAFLIVYSIILRSTFDEAYLLRARILRSRDGEDIPIVLVGNKSDLPSQRQVLQSEGIQLAKEWGDRCIFYETSAKEEINNEECFYSAVRLITTQYDTDIDKPGRRSVGCRIL